MKNQNQNHAVIFWHDGAGEPQTGANTIDGRFSLGEISEMVGNSGVCVNLFQGTRQEVEAFIEEVELNPAQA